MCSEEFTFCQKTENDTGTNVPVKVVSFFWNLSDLFHCLLKFMITSCLMMGNCLSGRLSKTIIFKWVRLHTKIICNCNDTNTKTLKKFQLLFGALLFRMTYHPTFVWTVYKPRFCMYENEKIFPTFMEKCSPRVQAGQGSVGLKTIVLHSGSQKS